MSVNMSLVTAILRRGRKKLTITEGRDKNEGKSEVDRPYGVARIKDYDNRWINTEIFTMNDLNGFSR